VLVGVRRSSRLHQAIGCYSAEFEEKLNIAAEDEFGWTLEEHLQFVAARV
jgi:hypothetical protein